MDCILDELNENIEISEEDSYEYVTFLRARIEYSLFFILGYLWNKNYKKISQEKFQDIISSLNRISIGDVIGAIRKLDVDKEIVNKAVNKVFSEYPNLRNTKIGHGYAPSREIVKELIECYEKMYNCISLLKKQVVIIIVENKQNNDYLGLRLTLDKYGRKEKWTCSHDIFPEENHFPRVYALMEGQYYKLSPFVMLLNRGRDVYVFNSLNDTLSGSVRLSPLFHAKEEVYQFAELAQLCNYEDNRKISMNNNTIMNDFEENFSRYHDIGIKKKVFEFLKHNQSSVAATIWGHGGVGKTACIQSVCSELFNDVEQVFDYIVFITAKDRIYNPAKGKIVQNDGNYVRHYCEVIQEINKVLFNDANELNKQEDLEEAERNILECKQKLLIVLDDYETFADIEKTKISAFVKRMTINYHKVIFTTRNNRFIIGETIPTNELDKKDMQDFLFAIIEEEYPQHFNELKKLVTTNANIIEQIYKATSGRAIFIYQFVYLFMQEGFHERFLNQLKDSKEAQDFLYGRLYDYLSEKAKYVFAVISQVANADMLFRLDMLEYLCSKCIPDQDEFETALKELFDQKIIERYGDSQGRIYASELFKIMEEKFAVQEDAFKSTVKNLLNSIGGKNINGSIQSALLNEADLSRISGNKEDTVSRYRRVLKTTDAPLYIRKKALLNVASYLAITCLNAEEASNIIAEFMEDFKDDSQVCSQYIDYLWQQEENKEKADIFLRKFFSGSNGHKKTSPKYFNLFAKSVGYCSNYDMINREYSSESMRISQYNKTINEFGKILFEHVSAPKFVFGRDANRHLVKVGLLQTVKLCRDAFQNEPGKLKLAEDICAFAEIHFCDPVYHRQFLNIQNEIYKMRNRVFEQYEVGNIVEGTVEYIQPYGLFIYFNAPRKGFVHISNVKEPRKGLNLLKAYSRGQKIKVQIISMGAEEKRISLKEI